MLGIFSNLLSVPFLVYGLVDTGAYVLLQARDHLLLSSFRLDVFGFFISSCIPRQTCVARYPAEFYDFSDFCELALVNFILRIWICWYTVLKGLK